MSAGYDKFNYFDYWQGREYEHEAEIEAIKNFLGRIPKINAVCDIGAGYGRLVPYYFHRANQIYLVDSSKKLLDSARKTFSEKKNINYVCSEMKDYFLKTRKRFDLVLCVRVAHHIENLNELIKGFNRVLKNDGYVIFEFPNKRHFKAISKNLFQNKLLNLIDVFPEDRRCIENIKKGTIPFYNYNPDVVVELFSQSGFKIIEMRSVSNMRSELVKRKFSKETIMWMEKKFQKIGAKFLWGPSIFILAKKIN